MVALSWICCDNIIQAPLYILSATYCMVLQPLSYLQDLPQLAPHTPLQAVVPLPAGLPPYGLLLCQEDSS